MLVVVHPDLEHILLQANVIAELQDAVLIMLGKPPAKGVSKLPHPLLLLGSELGPKPLLRGPTSRYRGSRYEPRVRMLRRLIVVVVVIIITITVTVTTIIIILFFFFFFFFSSFVAFVLIFESGERHNKLRS
jgi:hypothetical protein